MIAPIPDRSLSNYMDVLEPRDLALHTCTGIVSAVIAARGNLFALYSLYNYYLLSNSGDGCDRRGHKRRGAERVCSLGI